MRWHLFALQVEELVQCILTGLDMEFNPSVSAIVARAEGISIGELYTQLSHRARADPSTMHQLIQPKTSSISSQIHIDIRQFIHFIINSYIDRTIPP